MIANLTRGTKTASLHLPADRFQIAGVLSYLGVDRLDDYELLCEGQDSSGIMVSLEPTGIAGRNIAELCRNEKISLGRLNSGFRSLFKLPYEQQLGVMDRIASQKPEHFDDFRKTIDAAIDEDDEYPVKSRWKCDDDCDNWWEEDDPNYTDDLYDSFDDDCGQDCSCDECEYFCPNCGNCVLV